MLSLPSGGRCGILLALILAVSPAVRAQTALLSSCSETLNQAEERYAHEDFEAAEELVMHCMETAEPPDVIRGHRLLALAFIRQGRMTEAQFAVLRILATDYGYEPDEDRDPPFFVALVQTVQNQLRVETAEDPARPVQTEAVAAAPIRVRIDLPDLPTTASEQSRSASPAPDPAAPEHAPVASATDDTGRVNVNTASEADLQSVSGIGPALAARIVAYRADNGPFRTTDDLQHVRGIGVRSLETLRPQVTVGDGRFVHRFAAGGGRAGESDPAASSSSKVNLNTATAEELDELPGIGPALAGRIIAYREQVGPFRTVEQVVEVRGIGPRMLEGFVDRLTVR